MVERPIPPRMAKKIRPPNSTYVKWAKQGMFWA